MNLSLPSKPDCTHWQCKLEGTPTNPVKIDYVVVTCVVFMAYLSKMPKQKRTIVQKNYENLNEIFEISEFDLKKLENETFLNKQFSLAERYY